MNSSSLQSFRLPNGLNVAIKANPSAPVVALQVWVKTGSADERQDEAGIAHVHEHMLFKGTARRSVGEIASEVESSGGQINAYTTYDYTVYHLVLAARHVAVGLDILADAIQNSAFDEEELKRELLVVLEEWKRGEDSPGAKAYTNLLKTGLPRHPYGRPIIGTHESILSISRPKVLDFFQRWYRPNNMVLVVVGDVEIEQVKQQIEELFESFSPGVLPERIQGEDGYQDGARIIREQADFLESYLDFAFPIPSIHHEDVYALQVLSFILGGGESSRLYRTLKAEQQLVNSVFTHAFSGERGGLFIVGTSLEDGNLRAGLEQTIRELWRVKHERIAAEELKRARDNLESDFLYRKETSEGQAQQYGYFESVYHDLDYEEVYLSHLERVTREDLKRVANRYFNLQSLSLSLLAPKEAPNVPLESELERILSLAADGPPRTRKAKGDRQAEPGAVTAGTLENGLRLLIKENHNSPLVTFRVAAVGGLLFENDRTAGINNFLAGMITRGTKNHNYAELAEEVENLAGSLDGFSGRNSVGLTGTFLSKNWLRGLGLFLDALVHPTFTAEEVEKFRQEILMEIKNRDDDPGQIVFDLFHRSLYLSHPYRFPILGTAETIGYLSREHLEDYYRKVFSPERVVLAVVGDIDAARLHSQLRELLSPLAIQAKGLHLPDNEPLPDGIRRAEEVREKKQAHIVIGFQSCNFGSPDAFPLRVLQAVLSRQGGRLFLEIREKRGLAYSVSAFFVEGMSPGTLGVYAATDSKRIEECIESVLAELKRVTEEEITESELRRAQKYLIGSYEIGRQTISDQNAEICFNEVYGLGYDYGSQFAERIEAVGSLDVLRAARKYLLLDAYTLSVLRPADLQGG